MTRIQWVGALLGIAALISFLVLTPVSPLTSYGMRAAGVLLFTVIWWVFGPVDVAVTSALCVMLLAFTGTLSPAEAYRGLGDPLIWFLVGVFGIGRAMELSGVFRRFALFLMTRGFVQRSPWILPMMFLFAASLISGFMSWLAVFVIFMTILTGIFEAMGYRKGDAMPALLIMALAWGAEIGSVISPAGSALNPTIISWIQRDTGYVITYFQWMGFGVPMWIMRLGLLLLIFRFIMRPDVASFGTKAKEYIRLEYDKLGQWSAQEKITLGVFLGIILLWALPGMLDTFLTPAVKTFFTKNVGLHVPALVGASLLCLVRPKGRALLTVPEWMSAVEWGTIILVALCSEHLSWPSREIPMDSYFSHRSCH